MSALESAALVWFEARQAALALKRQRADERCEREEAPESDTNYPGVPPCYLSGSPAEWCEPCQRGQVIHERYQQAIKVRASAQRKLERACTRVVAEPAEEAGS